jgi:two-component system sensor histidine kinase KdpD
MRIGRARSSSSRLRITALSGYAAGVGVVALCVFISLLGAALWKHAAFLMVFPLGVLVVAARFGAGPGVLTALGGVLAFDYVFVPPEMAFSVRDWNDVLMLGVMLVVAGGATVFADRIRRQVESTRRQAELEALRNALLSALSHDLKGPLATLVGAGTALCEERVEPRARHEISRMVAEEAARLNRIVTRLLELTRLESGGLVAKPTLQAIDEVIGSALVRLEPQLQGRVVRTDVPETVPLASFDPVLIEQVLVNLLENVVRHTPERSPVDISVYEYGPQILVEVADSGPGVPAGDEERVFEKLYRVSPRRDGGMGLGLTICRAIVAAHAGRIWLENRPGARGAVVRMTLPVERQQRAWRPSFERVPLHASRP